MIPSLGMHVGLKTPFTYSPGKGLGSKQLVVLNYGMNFVSKFNALKFNENGKDSKDIQRV